MLQPGRQILTTASCDLTFDPKSWSFHPFAGSTTASLQQNRFILFQNIMFKTGNSRTGREHYALASLDWWRHRNRWEAQLRQISHGKLTLDSATDDSQSQAVPRLHMNFCCLTGVTNGTPDNQRHHFLFKKHHIGISVI